MRLSPKRHGFYGRQPPQFYSEYWCLWRITGFHVPEEVLLNDHVSQSHPFASACEAFCYLRLVFSLRRTNTFRTPASSMPLGKQWWIIHTEGPAISIWSFYPHKCLNISISSTIASASLVLRAFGLNAERIAASSGHKRTFAGQSKLREWDPGFPLWGPSTRSTESLLSVGIIVLRICGLSAAFGLETSWEHRWKPCRARTLLQDLN